ncbi:hypothetical protein Bca4012_058507 [Brassica carinata]
MLAVSLANAVDFSVVDNTGDSAGGRRFREEIGDVNYATKLLRAATAFTWRLFQQANKSSDRRSTPKISMVMENGNRVAYSSQDKIHFNAGYLAGVAGDWNGAGQALSGLIEGIADYERMKAGYAASHWVGPGQGNRWDQGYYATMRFLDYCNDLRNGFVAKLNMKMRNGYSDGFFVDLLGKDVNQLWREYKAKMVNELIK